MSLGLTLELGRRLEGKNGKHLKVSLQGPEDLAILGLGQGSGTEGGKMGGGTGGVHETTKKGY